MLSGVEQVARHHHERYDGSGYLDGLCYDEIPYLARIVAVADAFDAMTSNRVYREALSDEEILQELNNGMGVQFDPVIAATFIEMIEKKQIKRIVVEEETGASGYQ